MPWTAVGYHRNRRTKPLQTALRYPESILRGASTVPRPRLLAKILAADSTLAAWSERQRLEARLTRAVRSHLPRPVAAQVRALAADARCLELSAGAGAIAASLRQRVPDLLAALRREGWDFTEIRVRVQVRVGAESPVKSTGNQRDASDAGALFDLAGRLPDGPLRTSLARWSRRARGRS
jgi:hypothetical protein